MSLEKASITNKNNNETIFFMFNPENYSFSKSSSFNEIAIPGRDAPIIQFSKGNVRTLNLELMFDTYETQEDVRSYTEAIENLLYIDESTQATPICIFNWGSFTFTCVVESANTKFEMFLRTGVPVRASLSLALKEYSNDKEENFTSSVSKNTEIEYTIKSQDSIQKITSQNSNNSISWKEVAAYNSIEDPINLEMGISIKIPQKVENLAEEIERRKKEVLKVYNAF